MNEKSSVYKSFDTFIKVFDSLTYDKNIFAYENLDYRLLDFDQSIFIYFKNVESFFKI